MHWNFEWILVVIHITVQLFYACLWQQDILAFSPHVYAYFFTQIQKPIGSSLYDNVTMIISTNQGFRVSELSSHTYSNYNKMELPILMQIKN